MKRQMEGDPLAIPGPQGCSLSATLSPLAEKASVETSLPWVIAFHGLTLNRHFFQDLAPVLGRVGIRLLSVDFRGHGDSQGALRDTTLQGQAEDVRAVLRWFQDAGYGDKPFGFLSFSMGSAGVLQALGDPHLPKAKAIALWAPLLNTVEWSQRRLIGFQRIAPQELKFWKGQVVDPSLFESAQSLELDKQADAWEGPLFLAHADQDQNQLPSACRALAARRSAMDKPVEAWFPPKSGHLFAVPSEREELLQRTAAFYQRNLW